MNNNYININIEPCPKPRMTKSDKWNKRPVTQRYWDYKAYIRLQAKEYKYKPNNRLQLIFLISMPVSWSKRKRELLDGKPHQNKPDIDNLIKGILDAFFDNDNVVYEVWAAKCWSRKGFVSIRNLPELDVLLGKSPLDASYKGKE